MTYSVDDRVATKITMWTQLRAVAAAMPKPASSEPPSRRANSIIALIVVPDATFVSRRTTNTFHKPLGERAQYPLLEGDEV